VSLSVTRCENNSLQLQKVVEEVRLKINLINIVYATGTKRRNCICRRRDLQLGIRFNYPLHEIQSLEDGGYTFLRNVGNRLPGDKLSYPRITETSTHLLPNLTTSLSSLRKVRSCNGSERGTSGVRLPQTHSVFSLRLGKIKVVRV
jgi:hypothetical protein